VIGLRTAETIGGGEDDEDDDDVDGFDDASFIAAVTGSRAAVDGITGAK